MARELHDTLAHSLSAVSVQLEAVNALWDVEPGEARKILEQATLSTRSGLTEARRAIFASRGDLEWGTPVLYMRSPDGRIFDIAAAPETPAQPPASAPVAPAAPEPAPQAATQPGKQPTRMGSTVLDKVRKQLLEQLYGQALTAFYSEQWEQAVTLLEQVEAVPVSYTHLRAHETVLDIVCRLLLEKKKQHTQITFCIIHV